MTPITSSIRRGGSPEPLEGTDDARGATTDNTSVDHGRLNQVIESVRRWKILKSNITSKRFDRAAAGAQHLPTLVTNPLFIGKVLHRSRSIDLNVEADSEGVQEFVAVMQGVVDEHRQRKRSKTVRRARRSRINKRGF